MKRNVLIFGLILGLILCVNMFYMVDRCYNDADFKSNDVLGYAAMIVIFSVIYFGVRNYRNKELNGFITFRKAFIAGLMIALVASTLYVVVWLFYYYLFVPDFLDKYTGHVIRETDPAGLSARTKEMEELKAMYKNPLFVILITYSEVFPIGLVVALVSSLVLKKRPVS